MLRISSCFFSFEETHQQILEESAAVSSGEDIDKCPGKRDEGE